MSKHSSSSPVAFRLGAFAAEASFGRLPGEVVEAVKLRVLDLLAASACGVSAGNHRGLLALFPDDGPIGILGTSCGRSLRDAALINSAVAHSTYFEDGSRYTGGHPSSAVIPAALALALARGASGRTLIAAIAVGYEVFLRLGRAIYPATVRRGFQSTAILAAPASAAAAAVLLRLSPEQSANAIAIACSHGAGLKAALKSADSQPFQVGRSSEGGLLSALYAQAGASGYHGIVEHGFLDAFSENAQREPILADLGDRWHIAETYLKAHGGCRGNHAPVDAVDALMREHRLNRGQIQRIDVGVDSVTFAAAIEDPKNGDQAQFSIGFSIAALLVAGDVTPVRFSDRVLADSAVRDLMGRTHVRADAALDDGYPERRPAVVSIALTDGRTLRQALDRAKGEPENPMAPADVGRKFDAVAGSVFGAAASDIRDAVLGLDVLPELGPLGALLSFPSSSSLFLRSHA